MTLIKELNGISPKFGADCWFAETAVIVGDVIMGNECTVWYNAVLRGDVHSIEMGNKVNVQDNAVIHCTYQKANTVIGNNVSIGHAAIVHGCRLMDNVLIGMGAMVMDHAVVEEGALVAAGAVVLENTIVEAGYIYAGVPAKKIKLAEGNSKEMIERIANNYVKYAGWYKNS